MFAVIFIGGKQYKVREKDELEVEKIELDVEKNLKINEVLLVSDEDGQDVKLGMPYVAGAQVECKVVEHGRGDKIHVIKFHSKKRYSRRQGHRQAYTLLKVLKISTVGGKAAAAESEAPKAVDAEVKEPAAKKAAPKKKAAAKKKA